MAKCPAPLWLRRAKIWLGPLTAFGECPILFVVRTDGGKVGTAVSDLNLGLWGALFSPAFAATP